MILPLKVQLGITQKYSPLVVRYVMQTNYTDTYNKCPMYNLQKHLQKIHSSIRFRQKNKKNNNKATMNKVMMDKVGTTLRIAMIQWNKVFLTKITWMEFTLKRELYIKKTKKIKVKTKNQNNNKTQDKTPIEIKNQRRFRIKIKTLVVQWKRNMTNGISTMKK